MRTAFYYRTATKEQTTETQEQECRKILGNKDELVGVYEDYGLSGLDEVRPSLIKLIEDAKSDKFQKIVASEPSIIFRDVEKMIELKTNLEQHGVQLKFAKGSVDSDNLANLIATHLSKLNGR